MLHLNGSALHGTGAFVLQNSTFPVGRYVRLTMSAAGATVQPEINLAELEVLSGGLNVALGKPCSLSTAPYFDGGSTTYTASLAFDGKADTWAGSTPSGMVDVWLEVDLGAPVAVHAIRVLPRQECCASRGAGGLVTVHDASAGKGVVWSTRLPAAFVTTHWNVLDTRTTSAGVGSVTHTTDRYGREGGAMVLGVGTSLVMQPPSRFLPSRNAPRTTSAWVKIPPSPTASTLSLLQQGVPRASNESGSCTVSTVAGDGRTTSLGDGQLATSAAVGYVVGVLTDTAGRLVLWEHSDPSRVRRVDTGTGIISSLVNAAGVKGYGGDGGQAHLATLANPWSAVTDGKGDIYIVDRGNNRVRKVDAQTNVITTWVGTGTAGFSGDGGLASAAQLNLPLGLAWCEIDNSLIIADIDNRRIRKIDANGVISTIAGNGADASTGDGGLATAASVSKVHGLACDAAGNVYIGMYPGGRIRLINATTRIISTIVGTGTISSTGTGLAATAATVNSPVGVTLDAHGNLVWSELDSHYVRMRARDGRAYSVAGSGDAGFVGDGAHDGLSMNTWFRSPHPPHIDVNGTLWIPDALNYRVRRIASDCLAGGQDWRWGVHVQEGTQRAVRALRGGATSTSISDGKWHHVAVSYDGAVSRTYVDGALVGAWRSSINTPHDAALVVGDSVAGYASEQLAGAPIFDLRLYSRALSHAEIAGLAQPTLPRFPDLAVVNPTYRKGATSYVWYCSAGFYGATVSAELNAADSSWSMPQSAPVCTPCPPGTNSAQGSTICIPDTNLTAYARSTCAVQGQACLITVPGGTKAGSILAGAPLVSHHGETVWSFAADAAQTTAAITISPAGVLTATVDLPSTPAVFVLGVTARGANPSLRAVDVDPGQCSSQNATADAEFTGTGLYDSRPVANGGACRQRCCDDPSCRLYTYALMGDVSCTPSEGTGCCRLYVEAGQTLNSEGYTEGYASGRLWTWQGGALQLNVTVVVNSSGSAQSVVTQPALPTRSCPPGYNGPQALEGGASACLQRVDSYTAANASAQVCSALLDGAGQSIAASFVPLSASTGAGPCGGSGRVWNGLRVSALTAGAVSNTTPLLLSRIVHSGTGESSTSGAAQPPAAGAWGVDPSLIAWLDPATAVASTGSGVLSLPNRGTMGGSAVPVRGTTSGMTVTVSDTAPALRFVASSNETLVLPLDGDAVSAAVRRTGVFTLAYAARFTASGALATLGAPIHSGSDWWLGLGGGLVGGYKMAGAESASGAVAGTGWHVVIAEVTLGRATPNDDYMTWRGGAQLRVFVNGDVTTFALAAVPPLAGLSLGGLTDAEVGEVQLYARALTVRERGALEGSFFRKYRPGWNVTSPTFADASLTVWFDPAMIVPAGSTNPAVMRASCSSAQRARTISKCGPRSSSRSSRSNVR